MIMSVHKSPETLVDMEKEQSLELQKTSGDVALGVYHDVKNSVGEDNINARRLLWKIDLRLMPLL